MKRILFISVIMWAIITFECLSAEYSIDKGVYGIDGNISLNMERLNNADRKYNLVSLAFQPSLFYFILPRFAVGSIIEYNFMKSSGLSVYESKSWGFGPHVRYYYLNKEYKPYVYVDYQYNWYKSKTNGNNDAIQRNNKLSLGTGIDIFIVKNVALEPSLEYFTYRSSTDYTSKGLELNVGLSVFIY